MGSADGSVQCNATSASQLSPSVLCLGRNHPSFSFEQCLQTRKNGLNGHTHSADWALQSCLCAVAVSEDLCLSTLGGSSICQNAAAAMAATVAEKKKKKRSSLASLHPPFSPPSLSLSCQFQVYADVSLCTASDSFKRRDRDKDKDKAQYALQHSDF